MEPSIFLDFNLPTAATWFYFSLFLTVALFFQFTRLLSIRNLDLLMLFLLVPGFLILQEASKFDAVSRSLGSEELTRRAVRERTLGYAWLLVGSLYWFVRAIVDTALVRRPPVTANLNTPGLAWLALALFVGLTAVAVRRTPDQANQERVGTRPVTIEQVQETATAVVQQAQSTNGHQASAVTVQFWAERGLAMICHAAVLIGLLMIGWRHFGDITTGVAAAALYTLVPYTAYHIGQFYHVWPTAFLVWAIFCYRRPMLAGWLLGLAAGSAVFPALLFPLWFGFFSRRGAARFGLAFLLASASSIGVTALVLMIDGPTGQGIVSALNLTHWKPWAPPTTESIWSGTHWAYRLPLFVLFIGFLVSATIWPTRKNLSHLIAQSAAILVGIQFWHADRGGLYVLWYLPLLLLIVLRPNLSAAEPPPIAPGSVLTRLAGAAWRRVRPVQDQPNPLAV
ncbi:Uncharacterized protein OS=Planctomyces brasiliensis (strain ATCC 49424 / DSM 5305 / JCM 21570 / NBRC 103401 / IFAM 1448) GN=Plabr_4086 PE=4 SV=1 [Gemmata massiliana]|uniref:Glycosyltransferase RgtA/B/C/D-like domain-containing protein n=1 Tax=Gemmata massiliana TaxID=1210884 RepID=A0A6P2D2N2_9BACT|nr:hypothetical protein [Gemmata massiliana]VTR95363.1 Uncharacterized protein OS=Planctomyces brasiliensis (strain ATCC 49424 / DSM 5305 / JCM 21570 / NBRC 103401 / IFAM 1448) GN=Plabr_4086 PE=4 SV=1 [Gemmata massiliana]